MAGSALLLLSLVGVCIASGVASGSATVTSGENRIPDHYVVMLNESIAHPGAVARAQTAELGGQVGFVYSHALKGYSAELSSEAAAALRSDPRVKWVTPDRRVALGAQTNPTGIKRVFAIANTKLAINEKADVVVNADIAILDTGVEKEHPDLTVSKLVECLSGTCVEGEGAPSGSHGTHVAGTAAAIDNTSGVVGVAPGARIWSVKVSTELSGTEASFVAGLDWVTSKASEVEVANASLWCKCSMPNVEASIKKLVEKGVVFVTIAGNDGENAENVSPAKNPDAITTGAIADFDGEPGGKSKTPPCSLTEYEKKWGAEKDDTWANLSSWGPVVDIVAPGVCIRSTVVGKGTEIEGWSGTSMAAPHVAGAAAILAAQSNPNTKADVEKIRKTILEQGNKNWTAEHEGEQQPLLDVSNEAVFK